MRERLRHSLRTQLIVFTFGRTILNTGFRMVYPFLPAISRGLNVDLSLIALAVSGRAWLGLAGPLVGSLTDLKGRRASILLGMGVFSVGILVVTFWPSLPGLFISLLLSSGSKIILDPAVQAFLGDHVEYSKRGTAIAITELSWSTAFILGIPLVGFTIANWGWQAPFLMLSCLGLIAGLLLYYVLPKDHIQEQSPPTLRKTLRTFLAHPSAITGICIGILISAGNETVSIIYGAWMEQSFLINVASLGIASAIIGFAELSGEGFVATLTDRIGKRGSVAFGLAINILSCLTLPTLGQNLSGALIGLFFFYLSFEFTLVSSIPIMTELIPNARATTMSAFLAAFSAGRGIGAILGPALFRSGLLANCLMTAACNIVALIILLLFVRE